MLKLKAVKEFLVEKRQTEMWGSIIFLVPFVTVAYILKHYHMDTLLALACGMLASLIMDPIILSMSVEIDLEKESKVLGDCYDKILAN